LRIKSQTVKIPQSCLKKNFLRTRFGSSNGTATSNSSRPQTSGVKLTKNGYYCIPEKDLLDLLTSQDGSCFVQNFEVGHYKYGKVVFNGILNVAGLDLDEHGRLLLKEYFACINSNIID